MAIGSEEIAAIETKSTEYDIFARPYARSIEEFVLEDEDEDEAMFITEEFVPVSLLCFYTVVGLH